VTTTSSFLTSNHLRIKIGWGLIIYQASGFWPWAPSSTRSWAMDLIIYQAISYLLDHLPGNWLSAGSSTRPLAIHSITYQAIGYQLKNHLPGDRLLAQSSTRPLAIGSIIYQQAIRYWLGHLPAGHPLTAIGLIIYQDIGLIIFQARRGPSHKKEGFPFLFVLFATSGTLRTVTS
jgi:hypothetical protein